METIEQINPADACSVWKTYKGFEVITNKHVYKFFVINRDNWNGIYSYFSNCAGDYIGARLKGIAITNMRGQPARMRKSMFTLAGRYKWHTGIVRSVTLKTGRGAGLFIATNNDGTIGHDSIITCEKRRNQ